MGVLWLSTVPLTSGTVARIFGPRNLASLFGFVMFSHQIGAFFGSWLGGLVFDSTGSYDLALIISAALGLLAAFIHLPISPGTVTAIPATKCVTQPVNKQGLNPCFPLSGATLEAAVNSAAYLFTAKDHYKRP